MSPSPLSYKQLAFISRSLWLKANTSTELNPCNPSYEAFISVLAPAGKDKTIWFTLLDPKRVTRKQFTNNALPIQPVQYWCEGMLHGFAFVLWRTWSWQLKRQTFAYERLRRTVNTLRLWLYDCETGIFGLEISIWLNNKYSKRQLVNLACQHFFTTNTETFT